MNWTRRYLVVALAVTVLTAGSLYLWAAPVLPKVKLTDQHLTLADLKRLELVVDPLPKRLEDLGVKWEDLDDAWRQRLSDAGFELTNGKGDPILRLHLVVAIDAEVPDAIAVAPRVTLEQRVMLPNRDRAFMVPTYVHHAVGLEPERKLGPSMDQALRHMLELFIAKQRAAAAGTK